MTPRTYRLPLTMLVLLAMATSAPAAGATTVGPDAFGYYAFDSAEANGPTYMFEDISTTGTEAVSSCDDCMSGALPIGFSFTFYGVTYTEAYVSSNGFLTFSSGQSNGCCTGSSIPATSTPNNIVAAYWEDLYGPVVYKTQGLPGSQAFIVQWTDRPHYAHSGATVTMQIKLLEGSNNIEVHYQEALTDGGTHTMGIENADGTVGVQYFRGSQSFSSHAVCYTTNSAGCSGGDAAEPVPELGTLALVGAGAVAVIGLMARRRQ